MTWRTPSLLFVAALAVAWGLIGGIDGADLGGDAVTDSGSGAALAEASGFEQTVVRGEAQTQVMPPSAAAAEVALMPESDPTPVLHEFKDPPRAGMMFDVDTGEILWEHHADRELPIASLTKMMTAHLIAERHSPDEKVLISKDAPRTGGSMIGLLPVGKRVPLGALLKGLLLVSGNDAATALAEDDAGTVARFVDRMNEEADRMGLSCSHFTTPHGLEDENNYSCPQDLAKLARADLGNPRIAKIARTDHVGVPFPIKGGRLVLYNNNPFIRAGDPTITGLKTGYTDAAGRCYVTTARRGGRHLGVILLDTPDPLAQIPKLLELGAAA